MISITVEHYALIHEKDGRWTMTASGIISYVYGAIPLEVIPFDTEEELNAYVAAHGIEVHDETE